MLQNESVFPTLWANKIAHFWNFKVFLFSFGRCIIFEQVRVVVACVSHTFQKTSLRLKNNLSCV
jgi:hypothetical protein